MLNKIKELKKAKAFYKKYKNLLVFTILYQLLKHIMRTNFV